MFKFKKNLSLAWCAYQDYLAYWGLIYIGTYHSLFKEVMDILVSFFLSSLFTDLSIFNCFKTLVILQESFHL